MQRTDLPLDPKQAAAIERRRLFEKERKARFFDERTRLIGVDERALAQQVRERKEYEENERCREVAYAKEAEKYDKIAILLEKRQKRDQKELNRALNEFRFIHQPPSSRREFDLNDPESKKKDRPARVSDDDPRCGVSSMQKFVGEDLTKKSRDKYQREQMQCWFQHQMEERNAANCARQHDDHLHDLYRREMDQRACQLAKAEEECRRAVNTALRRYNEVLAAERAEQERVRRLQEQGANAIEIANCINSDLLTENPAQAISAFGPHRICPDRYKGFSPEQLAEIRQQQVLQIKEKIRMKEEQKRMNAEFDCERARTGKLSLLMERQLERLARDYRKQIARDNLVMARDHKAFQKYLKEEVYTNLPTEAFFAQFNTSTR
ncbi:unnamed protein product [Mesocestoides corti]|uniref:RIB43A-like with coiled-coils protein 2 n=1 Tax=Mesocestoides corti TaxID=53468 RepID=A0A0R3UJC1_MESCO|nr:unnamed protein product [Mesocestoides corti]